jgi:hypothetical protein
MKTPSLARRFQLVRSGCERWARRRRPGLSAGWATRLAWLRFFHRGRGQPIILPAGPIFLRDRAAIAQALLERRIPSVAAFRRRDHIGGVTPSRLTRHARPCSVVISDAAGVRRLQLSLAMRPHSTKHGRPFKPVV